MAGQAKHKYADAHAGGFGYFLSTGKQGAPCRQDIIHQKYMAIRQQFRTLQRENACNVFYSLAGAEVGLRGIGNNTDYSLSFNGEFCQFGNAFCQEFALVVTTLTETTASQRNGYDAINGLKEVGRQQIGCHDSAKIAPHRGSAVIFQLEDGATRGGAGKIRHIGAGAFNGNFLPEKSLYSISLSCTHVGTRKVYETRTAHHLLTSKQSPPTDGTLLGKY